MGLYKCGFSHILFFAESDNVGTYSTKFVSSISSKLAIFHKTTENNIHALTDKLRCLQFSRYSSRSNSRPWMTSRKCL